MRPKFVITLLILAAMVFSLMFWLRPKKGQTITAPPAQGVQSTNTTNIVNQIVSATKNSSAPTTDITTNSNGDVARRRERIQQFVEKHNIPVDFYGQFIDQDSNALAGVDMKVVVNHMIVPEPFLPIAGSQEIPLEQISGTDGRFHFTGASGDVFDINSIRKDGYESEPGKRTYGSIGGSYDNPVIFKMWSTNIHESLITGNKSFEIMPDGRSYFINLTDGTISESGTGDLKVWIQYTNQLIRGQLYDWSAGIDVINGGLLEVPQEVMNSGFSPDPPFAMYSAPTVAYVPSFSFQQQIKGGQSGEIGNRFFYLLLNGGKEYGKMSINLFAPYGHLHPGLVCIAYAINPSGSQILR